MNGRRSRPFQQAFYTNKNSKSQKFQIQSYRREKSAVDLFQLCHLINEQENSTICFTPFSFWCCVCIACSTRRQPSLMAVVAPLVHQRILTKFLRMPLPGSWKTKTGSPNHSFIQLLEGLVVGKTQLWFSNFLEKIHSQKIASDLQSESSSLVLKGLTVSPMHNPFCKEFIHSFKILCLHSFNIEKLYHQQVC